jgi:hypothetical protein
VHSPTTWTDHRPSSALADLAVGETLADEVENSAFPFR